MKIFLLVLAFFLITIPAKAQVQLSAGAGITSSINMGEIGPAPIFKGTLTLGDKFRLENNIEFSPMDKYTKAGWFASDGVDVLVFTSHNSGFFIAAGVDYRHRNGGLWAKNGIRVGGGVGYEKAGSQIRFSVKDKVISFPDNIDYYPYFELLSRVDYPLKDSNWSLRVEGNMSLFKYIQYDIKRTAFYSNAVLGFAYKWP